ncbi:MAG: hypothetical protein HYR66_13320 [Sphingobacteriales bacterium]|nr:hypothetical protein [Sphingobacteriales bacterium]MBI3720691.1 hypothetical protein [Sphingobacteriales bacterium]
MKKLSVIILLIVFLGSCNKTPEKAFFYNQTQCADKWGYGQTDEETIDKLRTYLTSQQIVVTNLAITYPVGNLIICDACSCPTGKRFKVTVPEEDELKLKAEGFN